MVVKKKIKSQNLKIKKDNVNLGNNKPKNVLVNKNKASSCRSKRQCVLNKSILNLFLIVIILALVLLLISIVNINSEDNLLANNNYKVISNNSSQEEIDSFLDMFLNNDSEFITEFSDKLEGTPKIQIITTENKASFESRYSFMFSKDVLDSYNFSMPEINDYILEYNNAIVLYDYSNNKIKSYFLVQEVGN